MCSHMSITLRSNYLLFRAPGLHDERVVPPLAVEGHAVAHLRDQAAARDLVVVRKAVAVKDAPVP